MLTLKSAVGWAGRCLR